MDLINIDVLDFISSCSFEYGILNEDGDQVVEVNIYNTDNTITTTKMKVKEVMFFTEYGTITIPGKFILEKVTPIIQQFLDLKLSNLIDRVLEKEITISEVRSELQRIALEIQSRIQQYLTNYIVDTNVLGDIIHPGKDDNRYIYNLLDLKKYIKCKVIFKN